MEMIVFLIHCVMSSYCVPFWYQSKKKPTTAKLPTLPVAPAKKVESSDDESSESSDEDNVSSGLYRV